MSSSGKGGNNRRKGIPNKTRFSGRRDESQKQLKKHNSINGADNLFFDEKYEKNRTQERPHWTAPALPANPITTPECPWCGKQIKDITTAICDKDTGNPVHFDCVLARISQMENLDLNDSVCYIGGGRFGIIHYNNPPDTRDFTIKKIFEWENKDINSEWRKPISEYYSLT
ncbi:MAG: hypothetical protein FWC22_07175 [Treponema sp.]|nr:hypothetical protein [Treponema sp.]